MPMYSPFSIGELIFAYRPIHQLSIRLDAADIAGPLDVQVVEACRFVAKNMKVAAFKYMGRLDRPLFDIAAVFEAMVNDGRPPGLFHSRLEDQVAVVQRPFRTVFPGLNSGYGGS